MVEQYFIFVVAACTAGKGRQGCFIRGYNIRGLTSNHKLPAIRVHVHLYFTGINC